MIINLSFNNKIKLYENSLMKLKVRVKKSLDAAPTGNLRVTKTSGRYSQFYLLNSDADEKAPKYKYLPKSEMNYIRELAQKEYDRKMLTEIERQIKGCKTFLANIQPDHLEKIYDNLSLPKKELVKPYIQSQEDYIQQWYAQHPQAQNPVPIQKGIRTDRGEIVRSKSEKNVADRLYRNHIPYVYEAALELPTGQTIYPDFMILNVAERKTYYYEHMGKMGDPDYSNQAIRKISVYNSCGIHLGESLLITMETNETPLDSSLVDDLIRRYLI